MNNSTALWSIARRKRLLLCGTRHWWRLQALILISFGRRMSPGSHPRCRLGKEHAAWVSVWAILASKKPRDVSFSKPPLRGGSLALSLCDVFFAKLLSP